MTDLTIDTSFDDLDLLDADCLYDPFDEEEEKDADEKAETFGYKGSPDEVVSPAPETRPQPPARERIERLFADMPPFKRWLLAILDTCRTPQNADALAELVNGFESRRQCVYSAASFCTMLEGAGALRKVTEEGAPYEEVEPQLVEVEENGRTYLRPTPPPPALWQTTPEGLEVLEEDDPLGDLLDIIGGREGQYVSVFREILGMCGGDGSSINQIKQQVNANPVLEYPKKSAQFFMDYLDRHGAIEWDGAWKVTALGQRLLDELGNA